MAEKTVLVDSSVLLDILTADPVWLAWSATELKKACLITPVIVNQIVCAEIAPSFDFDWPEIDRWLFPASFQRQSLPFEASVIAAEAHRLYRKRGGTKSSPMPDFYIGAHAQVAGYRVLTRDEGRFRTYFPTVELISPAAPMP